MMRTKYEINNHYINIYISNKNIILSKEEDINNINEKNINKDSFIFNSIGTLISCFPEKFSSPRQGNLLELTRGKIVLKKNIDIHCFDGIENFTYIWIIYVFHLNQGFVGSKVIPPKYPGSDTSKKLGIFATRTPHRYNPIGLTLCKFDKIEGKEIFISCVDMITGTPILDIKPYHHLESVDVFGPDIKYAKWIYNSCQAEKCKSSNNNFINKKLSLTIILIIILIIILLVLIGVIIYFYFFCEKKGRKKRAMELPDEEYEYTQGEIFNFNLCS